MSAKKSPHVSKTQKNKLLDIMKQRPHLRNGKFTAEFTYKKAQEEWQQIAEVLNAIPGSNKDWKMWRKTWQDLLSKIKGKSADINKSRRMTGGGPAPDPLDEFEESMASLLNPNSIVGHEGVQESVVIFEEFEVVNADHILYPNLDHTYLSTSEDHSSDHLMENGNNDVSILPPEAFQDTENQDPNTTVDTQNTSADGRPLLDICTPPRIASMTGPALPSCNGFHYPHCAYRTFESAATNKTKQKNQHENVIERKS